MTAQPLLPKNAPFTPEDIDALNSVVARTTPQQRAWLAGFFAGFEAAQAGGAAQPQPAAPAKPRQALTVLYASESGNAELDGKSIAMGRAFGLPYLVAARPQPGAIGGTTVHAAAAAGIPAIIAEAGSSGLLTEPETQMMVDGVANTLRALGMLDGEVRPFTPTEVQRFTWMRAPAEGMWYPSVGVGAEVREGQNIGRIGNLYGDTLADITAPHDGAVLFITSAPAMPLDGLIIAVGGA